MRSIGLSALRRFMAAMSGSKTRIFVDPARLEAAIDECVAFHGFPAATVARTSPSAMSRRAVALSRTAAATKPA